MKKLAKIISYILGIFLAIILAIAVYFKYGVTIDEPNVKLPEMANKPKKTAVYVWKTTGCAKAKAAYGKCTWKEQLSNEVLLLVNCVAN